MSNRLLHFRVTFAGLAVIAFLAGAWMESVWLTAPGAAAAGVSDLIGLLQSRARFNLPVNRAFRGGAESLPALGVAAFEPFAIGLTVAVVIFALMANGMDTVKLAKDRNSELRTSETVRRVLTGLASLSLLWIPLAATSDLKLGADFGLSGWAAAGIAFLVAGGAGSLALFDSLISVKVASRKTSDVRARNVDT